MKLCTAILVFAFASLMGLHGVSASAQAGDYPRHVPATNDIDSKDDLGMSWLSEAASAGDLESVKALIAKGASIESKDKYGRTALCHAARSGQIECVKALLEAGAKVNAKDKYVSTVLVDGALSGSVEVVKALLAAGANARVKTRLGETVLTAALGETRYRRGLADCIKPLVDAGADINSKLRDGRTALTLALMGNDLDTAKALISAGANVNSKDDSGKTALIYAIESAKKPGFGGVVKALLDAGADKEATAIEDVDFTVIGPWRGIVDVPLGSRVVYTDHHRGVITVTCVAAGGEIRTTITGRWEQTPLIIAARESPVDVVKALIDAGAQVNQKNSLGETPLIAAGLRIDIIFLLTGAGAQR